MTPSQRKVDLVADWNKTRTADHCAHSARCVINRYDRGLNARFIFGKLRRCSCLSSNLVFLIQRCIDLETTAEKFVVTILIRGAQHCRTIEQIVFDLLSEIRTIDVLLRNDRDLFRYHTLGIHKRTHFRFFPAHTSCSCSIFRNQSNINQPGKHNLVTSTRCIRASNWVVTRWSLNEPCKKCALGYCQRRNRHTEIHLGCRLQTICVVTKEHRIEIPLENEFFGDLFFQHHGIARLQHLVSTVSIKTGKKVIFDNLLRNCGSTLTSRTLRIG